MKKNEELNNNLLFAKKKDFWESAYSEAGNRCLRVLQIQAKVRGAKKEDEGLFSEVKSLKTAEKQQFKMNLHQLLEKKHKPKDVTLRDRKKTKQPAVIGSEMFCGHAVSQSTQYQLDQATVGVLKKRNQSIFSEVNSSKTTEKEIFKKDLQLLLEKQLKPQVAAPKVVNKKNLWDPACPADGTSHSRAEMSCGYTVSQSLTSQRYSPLDQATVRNPRFPGDVIKKVYQGVTFLETAEKQSELNIRHQEEMVKKYDPLDTTLTFVSRSDDLDPLCSEEDEVGLRAEMSCGHAVTPQSLTQWCRSQLDEGNNSFRCPAIVEGTKWCNAVWSYQEVRRLADLSLEEMQHFEDTIARRAAAQYCNNQPCPQCKTSVERKDLSNLCVQCTICSADQKKTYQFCWQCQKQWKGAAPRSDRCDNDGCVNKDLELLQTCRNISLPEVEGATSCPSVRVCPTCGMKVEHSRQYCKNINCPRCKTEFCFLCLKLKSECGKTSSPYKMCSSGVAPRQTSIPVWRKK